MGYSYFLGISIPSQNFDSLDTPFWCFVSSFQLQQSPTRLMHSFDLSLRRNWQTNRETWSVSTQFTIHFDWTLSDGDSIKTLLISNALYIFQVAPSFTERSQSKFRNPAHLLRMQSVIYLLLQSRNIPRKCSSLLFFYQYMHIG